MGAALVAGVAVVATQLSGDINKSSKRGTILGTSQNIEARLRAALSNKESWDTTKADGLNAAMVDCLDDAAAKAADPTNVGLAGCAAASNQSLVVFEANGSPLSQEDPTGKMTDGLIDCAASSTDVNCRWRVVSTWSNEDTTGMAPRLKVRATLSYVPQSGKNDVIFRDRVVEAYPSQSFAASSVQLPEVCAALGGIYDKDTTPPCRIETAMTLDPHQVCTLLGQSYNNATSRCSGATPPPPAGTPETEESLSIYAYRTPNIWGYGPCNWPKTGNNKNTKAEKSFGELARSAALSSKNLTAETKAWYQTLKANDVQGSMNHILTGKSVDDMRALRKTILDRPPTSPLNASAGSVCPNMGTLTGVAITTQSNRDAADSTDVVSRCHYKVKSSLLAAMKDRLEAQRIATSDAAARMVAAKKECPVE